MIVFSKFNSLFAMANYFSNDGICKKAIIENRWGNDVICPHCGKHHCKMTKNGRFIFDGIQEK